MRRQTVRASAAPRRNTIVRRHIDRSRLLPDAAAAPSGAAEVSRLQAREGIVHLRP